MLKFTRLGFILIVFFQNPGQLRAREIEAWSYPKLFREAELVLIAAYDATVDAGDSLTEKPPASYLRGVFTTLNVIQVVKGKYQEKRLTLVHYRYKLKRGTQVANGPSLATFHKDRVSVTYPGGSASMAPPEYLLFLRRRGDGRFECISGQMDAALSVRQIVQPLR
jgi:hypothetical protein